MNKKALAIPMNIVLLVSFVAGLLSIAHITGVLNMASIIGYGNDVYKIQWGSVCCEQGSYEPPYIRYTDDVSLYQCDAYTDECRIKVHLDQDIGLGGKSVYYQICDGNGNSCSSKNRISFSSYSEETDTRIIYIDYRQSIKFSPYLFPNQNDWGYIVYEADYRPYYIKGMENGKVFVEQSCNLNTELRSKILSGGLNSLDPSPTSPNHCQNYMLDYVRVSTNIYRDSGRDVICQARDIYKVETLRFMDGNTIKKQGDRIRSVECCPHEANCNEDFEFVEDDVDECSSDNQCANGGKPIAETGTTYITFGCVSGECVKSNPQNVECTNNAICVDKFNDPNKVCKNFKCEDGSLLFSFCGDGICEGVLGETPTSCPNDCGNWEKGDGINWFFWFALVLVVFILYFFRGQLLALIKMGGRKAGL